MFWFYSRHHEGNEHLSKGFYYSNILECSRAVETPGYFGTEHALGPFKDYNEASAARHEEITNAKVRGSLITLVNVKCHAYSKSKQQLNTLRGGRTL